jgi:hypothetical protein
MARVGRLAKGAVSTLASRSCAANRRTACPERMNSPMNSVVVIPARMASTRLPGKPLADIHGRPMIAWMVDCSWRRRNNKWRMLRGAPAPKWR